MGKSDDNQNPNLFRRSDGKGSLAGVSKPMAPVGHNRRALRDVNRNTVELPSDPFAVKKRSILEKDAACGKNSPLPVHRPITRKFAEQMAHQTLIEGGDRQNDSVPRHGGEPDDCIIIDAEDYKENEPVPMYVQHTEAMLEEIDQMDEEVEMDVVDEDPVVDIDRLDNTNSLAVSEYVNDIYVHYKKRENDSCVPSNYMEFQGSINGRMRGILIDWLIEVHDKFELREETLYLTVNLIDRFLSLQRVVKNKLKLVGVTAMLIACKYEEVLCPVMEDFIGISGDSYCGKDLLQMESLMVNTLQFKLTLPTPYVFLLRFLKAAESDKNLELLSSFMIELCLVEYEMLQYKPSLLAAAAVFAAQCTQFRFKHWSKTCEWHTDYSEDQLLECSRLMVTYHQNASTGTLKTVYRKYNTPRFGYVAQTDPAVFLLETRF